jgi:hypothetical protein
VIGLANIDIPRGKQAVQAWRRLGWRTRQEVIQWAWRGLGHPDPGVATIAVGRAQVMLRASLRRWVLVVGASLLVNWPLLWVIGRLMGGLAVQWVQWRQVERVNLPMIG